MPMSRYSVIVPFFNELESLAPFWAELEQASALLTPAPEVLFVDDGSTDGSSERLEALLNGKTSVRLLRLPSHRGKSEALRAGWRQAGGEVFITLDSDLQDDPFEIPRLLKALEDGADFATGWRKVRRDSFFKRTASFLFNGAARRILRSEIRDLNCGLKAYRRRVAESLELEGDFHRFLPYLAARAGFKVAEVPVNHRPRLYGRSKYGWERPFRGVSDLLKLACSR